MMNNTNTYKTTDFRVAGIGEILWDIFPNAQRLGGAPANFACHCNQLGATAYPVSCIGSDELGHKACEELRSLSIDTAYVQVNDRFPTGRVLVELDEMGKPNYQILEDMAWDHLVLNDKMKNLARSLNAVCFGVLAQRSDVTRGTIRDFLELMPAGALKILDVNLRKPFFSKSLVEESLHMATVLKLSDEELPVLSEYFNLSGSVTEKLTDLLGKFGLDLIAYTRGAEGSILITAEEISESPGLEVTPIDSVGAGDSFTAALCVGLLRGRSLSEVGRFANQVAAFVCSNSGAAPILPEYLKAI